MQLRPWFLQTSGLGDEQITEGFFGIHAYPTKAVTLPLHSPTDPDLLLKADLAYSDGLGQGLVMTDSSPTVANSFAEIYNACGVSCCVVRPALECSLNIDHMFAIFAACELTEWPKFQDIRNKGEVWRLAVAAVKEIKGLSIHRQPGQKAARETTESELAASLVAWERHMLPLDLQSFNRFHHGNKVNAQDHEHLRACLSYGEADGNPMYALKELLQRVESRAN